MCTMDMVIFFADPYCRLLDVWTIVMIVLLYGESGRWPISVKLTVSSS